MIVINKTFTFNKESKENGELYGSIKPKEICNLIKEKTKADVNSIANNFKRRIKQNWLI